MKNQKGITLIAVIVTVIVMLILAGVSINIAIGNNGIISNSQNATEKTKTAEAKEYILEAWGATLANFEEKDLDEMDYSKITSEGVGTYFTNYMSSYGSGQITAVGTANGKKYFQIKCTLTGEREEKDYYIVDDTVYTADEFSK